MKTKLLLLAVILTLVLPVGTQAAAGPFSDVPTTHPYYGAIKYLKDNNFVSGYPDGHYAPDAPISRVEATKIVLNAFGVEWHSSVMPVTEFLDVPKDSWYYPLLNTSAYLGIVRGYSNGYFGVNDRFTRSQAAKVIVKASGFYANIPEPFLQYFDDVPVNYTDDLSKYVYFAAEKNFIDTTSPNFGLNVEISRGEFSEFIYRIIYTHEHALPAYLLYSDLNAYSDHNPITLSNETHVAIEGLKKFGKAFYAFDVLGQDPQKTSQCNVKVAKLDDSSGQKNFVTKTWQLDSQACYNFSLVGLAGVLSDQVVLPTYSESIGGNYWRIESFNATSLSYGLAAGQTSITPAVEHKMNFYFSGKPGAEQPVNDSCRYPNMCQEKTDVVVYGVDAEGKLTHLAAQVTTEGKIELQTLLRVLDPATYELAGLQGIPAMKLESLALSYEDKTAHVYLGKAAAGQSEIWCNMENKTKNEQAITETLKQFDTIDYVRIYWNNRVTDALETTNPFARQADSVPSC